MVGLMLELEQALLDSEIVLASALFGAAGRTVLVD